MVTSTHLQTPEYFLPEDIVRFSGGRLSMGFSHATMSRSSSSSNGGHRRQQPAPTTLKHKPSSTTLDSDPCSAEILSWSALINAQMYSPCIQSVPTDICRPVVNGEDAASLLSMCFDPTTLDIGFDYTCLDGLDDILLHSPMEAFAEACWEDAVRVSTHPDRTSTPTPSRSIDSSIEFKTKVVRESRTRAPVDITFNSSDESDESDSDECKTCHDDDEAALSFRVPPMDKTKNHHHQHHQPAVDEGKSMMFDDPTDQLALLGLELDASARAQHFHIPDPNQSVGYFPIPVKQKKPVLGTGRIAAFWGNFPKPARMVMVKSSP